MLSKELFKFLEQLKKHNTREWFNTHKPAFLVYQAEAKSFFKEIDHRLEQTDQLERYKVFRIYRDVRFSKDKSPYKTRFAGYFIRATKYLRGGYYLNIEPGNSMVGGGFYGPNSEDLKRIRKEFEHDDTEIRAVLEDKNFKAMFGKLRGTELKSAPRGFDVGHPAIDLIRRKQFYVARSFSDAEVMSPDFSSQVIETYLILRPFFDYMSSVLTTNLDGETIL